MSETHGTRRPPTSRLARGVLGAAVAVVLSACSPAAPVVEHETPITIGTTATVSALDPAAAGDAGSRAVQAQVYPYLLASPFGSGNLEPDIAESARFTSATEYTVVLKPDLEFANGNALTSSDVVFSFDRQRTINAGAAAGAPLANLASTTAVDATTVVFTLTTDNDALFPRALASAAAAILDEQTFAADALTPDSDIVAAEAFAGPYTLIRYEPTNLLEYRAYAGYQGLLGQARTTNIVVKYYTSAANLKLDVQEGNIDVAWGSLTPSDVDDLRGNDAVRVVDEPGGDIRFLAFNADTQPFGATTAEADAAKAHAIRVAVAHLIDRPQLAAQVYTGSMIPLYSVVPAGVAGAAQPMKGLYGDSDGGPDPQRATETLTAAGITLPVALTLHYSADLFGGDSVAEYAVIQAQLEATGAFAVTLVQVGAVQYEAERRVVSYPFSQSGRLTDYADADNYIRPVFGASAQRVADFALTPDVSALVTAQATVLNPDERRALIQKIQDELAATLPTVPLLQSTQIAVTGTDIAGVADTLDASFTFRYAALFRE